MLSQTGDVSAALCGPAAPSLAPSRSRQNGRVASSPIAQNPAGSGTCAHMGIA